VIFNSLTYLVFLPCVVALYWLAPQRWRLWLVFVSSLVFYGFWRIDFIPLILLSAGIDYLLARAIEDAPSQGRKKLLLGLSVGVSLLILAIFKYSGLLLNTTASIGALFGFRPDWPTAHILLPLGISFYIFATISYVVDVYRGLIRAERDPLVYFCFIVFFPHLVAGPILRAGVLIPQLRRPAGFSVDLLTEGARRILMGLFLKVVLADHVAPFVNQAFQGDLGRRHGADAWTMAFLFGFQVYFDFSGYSHIAIGSARLLGITLPENFNFPYLARSPREFWRRWHISLSTWVRDYLYLPLIGAGPTSPVNTGDQGWEAMPAERGARDSEGRRTRALFVTWTLMGLWHGGAWTFAVWGLYHALLIWAQRLAVSLTPGLKRWPAALGWVFTFPAVMAGWIPFRAPSVRDAFLLWFRMVDPRQFLNLSLSADSYALAAFLTPATMLVYLVRQAAPRLVGSSPFAAGAAQTVLIAILFAGDVLCLEVRSQFIYFQF
jgi:D-alanyl-lipoteichoic acid acyltransferase DltB (MBOAT superfamily)